MIWPLSIFYFGPFGVSMCTDPEVVSFLYVVQKQDLKDKVRRQVPGGSEDDPDRRGLPQLSLFLKLIRGLHNIKQFRNNRKREWGKTTILSKLESTFGSSRLIFYSRSDSSPFSEYCPKGSG